MFARPTSAIVLTQLLWGLLVGCQGNVGSAPSGSGPGGPGSVPGEPGGVPGGAGGGPGGPGSVPGAVTPRPGDSVPEEACAPVTDPGASPLRLLSRAEYLNTVRDLTGIDAEALGLLAPADRVVTTFERTSANFALEKRQVFSFLDVAEAAAKHMLMDPASRAKFLGCEPTGTGRSACLTSFASNFGRKAYRRPLASEELAALIGLAESTRSQADPYAGPALIIQGVLQSPKFLMHVELGSPGAPGERRALTGFERAARLSYLALGTAPDAALLATAESGGLDQSVQVEQVAGRLLEDARVRTNLRGFFQQWLGIAKLDEVLKDTARFPQWNDTLRRSMLEETTRLFEEYAWTPGKNFAEILTAQHTYIDANLAQLYGMPAPAAPFQRTELAGSRRFGLLTQASWLAVMSGGDVTPIRRGKFIRSSLLCAPPIPLPPGVPDLSMPSAGESERQLLERHRADPQCAACHKFLDPLGFGLARYDGIGAYRELDERGQGIDESGVFSYDSNPNVRIVSTPEFQGPGQLVAKLGESGAFPACAVEKLFEFALARPEANRCVSQPVKRAFAAAGYDFKVAVTKLVASDVFLYRRDPLQ